MYLCVFLLWQAEQEVQNLMRKLKLLENDLDQAEDQKADSDSKAKDLEVQNEELIRENKQLQNRVNVLEGKFSKILKKWTLSNPVTPGYTESTIREAALSRVFWILQEDYFIGLNPVYRGLDWREFTEVAKWPCIYLPLYINALLYCRDNQHDNR